MPTEADIMGALRKADAAGDTSSAQRFAAMLKTVRQSPQDRASAAGREAGGKLSQTEAGIAGAADAGTFGMSNYLNAGARYVAQRATGVDNPDDFSTDLAFSRGANIGAAEAHPAANIAGQVTGTVLGGGLASVGLKAASKVPGVIGTVADAIGFQPAQTARNILRAVGLGSFISGVQAGNDTGFQAGPTMTGAVAGGVTAPLALAAGPVVRKLLPSGAKANAMLAKIIGEDAGTIEAARQNFRHATVSPGNPQGTEMPMAALMTLKQQGALRDLANANPDLATALSHAGEDVAQSRPSRMADTLEGLMGAPQDLNTLHTHIETAMTQAMRPIRGRNVTVTENDLGRLLDPDAYGSLRANSPLRAHLGQVDANIAAQGPRGTDNSLTVDDIDNLRQAIRGRRAAAANPANTNHNLHTANELGDLMDRVTDIASSQVPEYGQALDDYRAGRNYIDAFKHGAAGKSAGDADTSALRAALLSPAGAQGHSAGVATRLITGAGKSESGALSTAADLTQPGTNWLVNQTQAPGVATRASALGRAEQNASKSLRGSTPASIQPDDGADPQTLLHSIAAATYHSPTVISYHAAKAINALSGMKMSPATRQTLIRYVTDPTMTQQAVNIMRRAGQTDADIRRFATGLAASIGSQAGATVTRGQ